MTLIFDKRNELQDQPGFHVLIAGVSAYPHLPGGSGKPAEESFGMQQLSSAALTAYKIYHWLLDQQNNLPIPLATIRLLLSPSPEEVGVEPQLSGLVDVCTRRNFAAAAQDWRKDASLNSNNITFFYFAGHGVQRIKDDAVLLLENFGDPVEAPLTNAASTGNLFYGMASSNSRLNMAQTQLYFVDACRNFPSKFKDFERMTVPDVFPVELTGRDDRRAPIFYASIADSKAYAVKGKETLFSKALLNCLSNIAGEPGEEDSQGEVKWCVSVYSLSRALEYSLQKLNKEYGADQDCTFGGHFKDTLIIFRDRPPSVDLILEVEPTVALDFTRMEVRNGRKVVSRIKAPIKPHPYLLSLPAGSYKIIAKVDPPNPAYIEYKSQPRLLMPPYKRWQVRMIP